MRIPMVIILVFYEQSMILQIIIFTFTNCEVEGERSQKYSCHKTMTVLKIKEMRYAVIGLLHNLVSPLWHLYL